MPAAATRYEMRLEMPECGDAVDVFEGAGVRTHRPCPFPLPPPNLLRGSAVELRKLPARTCPRLCAKPRKPPPVSVAQLLQMAGPEVGLWASAFALTGLGSRPITSIRPSGAPGSELGTQGGTHWRFVFSRFHLGIACRRWSLAPGNMVASTLS